MRYGIWPPVTPQFHRWVELMYATCAPMSFTLMELPIVEFICTAVNSEWLRSVSLKASAMPPPSDVP